jgi:hypothetical protein
VIKSTRIRQSQQLNIRKSYKIYLGKSEENIGYHLGDLGVYRRKILK